MQNLVLLMEPSKDAYRISPQGGNMFLNRHCIDEDAAFELSGVRYLKKLSSVKRKSKGKEYYSSLQYTHSEKLNILI